MKVSLYKEGKQTKTKQGCNSRIIDAVIISNKNVNKIEKVRGQYF